MVGEVSPFGCVVCGAPKKSDNPKTRYCSSRCASIAQRRGMCVERTKDPIGLFLQRVRLADGGCWVWLGAIRCGLPSFSYRKDGKEFVRPACRFSASVAGIHGKNFVSSCGNKLCVFAPHLRPRGVESVEKAATGKFACGHVASEVNTSRDRIGRTKCVLCKARYRKEWTIKNGGRMRAKCDLCSGPMDDKTAWSARKSGSVARCWACYMKTRKSK